MTKQIIYKCDNFKIHQNKRDDDAIASFLYLPNAKNVAKFKYNGNKNNNSGLDAAFQKSQSKLLTKFPKGSLRAKTVILSRNT